MNIFQFFLRHSEIFFYSTSHDKIFPPILCQQFKNKQHRAWVHFSTSDIKLIHSIWSSGNCCYVDEKFDHVLFAKKKISDLLPKLRNDDDCSLFWLNKKIENWNFFCDFSNCNEKGNIFCVCCSMNYNFWWIFMLEMKDFNTFRVEILLANSWWIVTLLW